MKTGFCKQCCILLIALLSVHCMGARILTIRPIVSSKERMLRLKDFVSNDHLLSDSEKEFEVMKTPTDKDKLLSIIDFAYLLQQYEEMMDAKVSGPRKIRLKRTRDTELLERMKDAIIAQTKQLAPWREWQIDMMFSSSDEATLTRIKSFDSVDVLPYGNNSMLGNVQLKVSFFDKKGHDTGVARINPVILKKVDVAVINNGAKKGHIIDKGDVKTVGIWVGGNRKEYIEDPNECYGRELARSLTSGDFLTHRDLLNPICSKRGDLIRVESRKGGLSVKIIATAMQAGRKGEVIKLENRSSKKVFSATLTGIKEALYER